MQRAIDMDIRRLPPDAACLKPPSMPVGRPHNQRAAFKGMWQEFVLVLFVLRLFAEGDIARSPEWRICRRPRLRHGMEDILHDDAAQSDQCHRRPHRNRAGAGQQNQSYSNIWPEPRSRFRPRAIARLGGCLARKHDAPPGPTVLWRGVSRLADIVIGFEAAQASLHGQTCG